MSRILPLLLRHPQHISQLSFHCALRSLPHFQPTQTPSNFHTSSVTLSSTFTNILADDNPPPVQVSSITHEGIQLADGLVISSACIFLEGKVFLWDVPESLWAGWGKDHFEIFEVVVPKPGENLFITWYYQVHYEHRRDPITWDRKEDLTATAIPAYISESTGNSA